MKIGRCQLEEGKSILRSDWSTESKDLPVSRYSATEKPGNEIPDRRLALEYWLEGTYVTSRLY